MMMISALVENNKLTLLSLKSKKENVASLSIVEPAKKRDELGPFKRVFYYVLKTELLLFNIAGYLLLVSKTDIFILRTYLCMF